MDFGGGAPAGSNKELVGRFYALWNDDALEATRELFTEDASSGIPPGWPQTSPVRNRDQLMGAFRELRGMYDADRLEAHEVIELGDRVIVPTCWSATPKGGSIDLEMEVVPVFGVRDGRIAHISWYESTAQAIEAVERFEPAAGT